MDTKIKVKEEDPFSDNVASHSKTVFFTNSDAAFLHDVPVKTEMKSETSFPEFCLQNERECFIKLPIKSESVTCSNICEVNIKTESTLPLDLGSQNEREQLLEDSVMKYNSDHEAINKIEIKEEPHWLKTEILSVCNDIKDEDGAFSPVKSRLCSSAVSGDGDGRSPFPSAEDCGKNTSFYNESDVTQVPPHCINCDDGETCSTALYENLSNEGRTQISSIKSKLKKHKYVNGSERRHKCEVCEKRFSQLSHLKVHSYMHEGEKPHKCDLCEKRYTQFSHLKVHKLIHEGKRPHKCDVCDKRFIQISDMKVHKLIHESNRPHKCQVCGKGFTRASELRVHNLIHEGKKPHKCEICEKRFTQSAHLRVHILIHEGKRPHKCEICGKRFTQLSRLKVHNLTHKGEKPHKCEICQKTFTWLSLLKAHSFIHEGKKPYMCPICPKGFTQLPNLKRHVSIHQRPETN